MKKLLLTITVVFVTLLGMAQAPNLFNYQGVARNAVGNVIPNQLIGLRLSIVSGSPTGPVVYQETRNVFTNAFGLFNVVVGSPGFLSQTGTIAGVNWAGNPIPSGAANKYLTVEIDPQGGSNFTNVGTTQLVSVPFALVAGGAGPIGPAGGDLTGTYPNPQLAIPLIKTASVPASPMISMTNTATTGTTSTFALFGSSASTDANARAIEGVISSTSPGGFSAGVKGTNNGGGGNGIGVYGSQNGNGWGVYGLTPSGNGVRGESGSGFGVVGLGTGAGIGVYGTSAGNAAGYFENTTAANTNNTITATSVSAGNVISGINTGTGRGGFFQVNNAASTANAIEATTNGTGASWGIRANSTGTNGAGLFVQTNATNTANNVQSNQGGLGSAGLFQATNTANNADALVGTTATTGTTASGVRGTAGTSGTSVVAKKGVWGDTDSGVGVFGTSSSSIGVSGISTTGFGVSAFGFGSATGLNASSLSGNAATISVPAANTSVMMTGANAGTGNGFNIDNTNATATANTIAATNANGNSAATGPTNGGGNAIFARKGAGLTSYLTNPTSIYASAADPTTGSSVASLGMANNGLGMVGVTLGSGTGVEGLATAATGTGVIAANLSTGYALFTSGKVQISGQGAAAGRVLGSDAVGNATWQSLSGLGIVGGSGTLNYVPKWTPNGTTLGNSQIFDDGTNVGVGTGSPNAKLDVANASNTTRASQMINSSTTNPSSTIFAQNNSIGGVDPVESSAITGLFSPIAVATNIISGPSAIKGIASPNALSGAAGGIGVQGASGGGYGVAGVSSTGTGVYAYGVLGSSYALQTNGRVQIQGQGAGAGKVLSSDATGNATWNSAAALNIVSGNGTLNYMTKWSPDGNTIANSQVFDNGSGVGINTNTPGYRLDVVNNGSDGIRSKSSSSFSVVDIDGATGDAALRYFNAGVSQWNVRNNPATNDYQIFEMGGGGERMQIQDGTGNVGIGGVSPAYRLDVLHGGATGAHIKSSSTFSVVDIDAANGDAALRLQRAGVGQWNLRNRPADDYFEIFELGGGGSRFVIQDGTGNVGIGGVVTPAYRLDVLHGGSTGAHIASSSSFSVVDIDAATGDAALRFQNAGTGMWNTRNEPTNNDYQIFQLGGGGERFRIQRTTGNIGINQANPAARLDVNGTFKLTDGSQGAGKVLTSDAAGLASWTDISRAAFKISGGTGPQVVNAGAQNTITNWGVTEFNLGGGTYNAGTGTYTVAKSGIYDVSAKLKTAAHPSSGYFNIEVAVNGVYVSYGTRIVSNVNFNETDIVTKLQLNAGDQVRIDIFNNTGSPATFNLNSTPDMDFSIVQIR